MHINQQYKAHKNNGKTRLKLTSLEIVLVRLKYAILLRLKMAMSRRQY